MRVTMEARHVNQYGAGLREMGGVLPAWGPSGLPARGGRCGPVSAAGTLRSGARTNAHACGFTPARPSHRDEGANLRLVMEQEEEDQQ